MRRQQLILLVLVLGIGLALARPAQAQGVGFGVEGMITNTSFHGGDAKDLFDSRTGSGVGLWVGGNRFGTVGFVGEFVYLVKKIGYPGNDELKIQSLHIPAVFHINIGASERDVFGYIIAGPSFTINVKEELKSGLAGDNFAGADVGFIGGAGVEIYHFALEGRMNWGFRNISDSGATSDLKTRSVEVVGKFRFN